MNVKNKFFLDHGALCHTYIAYHLELQCHISYLKAKSSHYYSSNRYCQIRAEKYVLLIDISSSGYRLYENPSQ